MAFAVPAMMYSHDSHDYGKLFRDEKVKKPGSPKVAGAPGKEGLDKEAGELVSGTYYLHTAQRVTVMGKTAFFNTFGRRLMQFGMEIPSINY